MKTIIHSIWSQSQSLCRAQSSPEVRLCFLGRRFVSNSSQSFTMNRDYALAIMLRRLAYPSRLTDLELIFNIAYATIGMIFN
ncbi:hypothetical protein BD770DRAFT_472759 [Pilaira anomala]|nr:hypothetical protein BD770DRAFT_472759 [Pilaira anomala]